MDEHQLGYHRCREEFPAAHHFVSIMLSDRPEFLEGNLTAGHKSRVYFLFMEQIKLLRPCRKQVLGSIESIRSTLICICWFRAKFP